MRREKNIKNALNTVSNFFVFFLLAAFVTTCCIMLFVTALQDTLGRNFTQEEITLAAKITLVNVILISAVMATIDYLRRKIKSIIFCTDYNIYCSNLQGKFYTQAV